MKDYNSDEYHRTDCHYPECCYAESHQTNCHYSECRYTECCCTFLNISSRHQFFQQLSIENIESKDMFSLDKQLIFSGIPVTKKKVFKILNSSFGSQVSSRRFVRDISERRISRRQTPQDSRPCAPGTIFTTLHFARNL